MNTEILNALKDRAHGIAVEHGFHDEKKPCGRADGRGKTKLGKGGGMKEDRCTAAAYQTGGKAAAQQQPTERSGDGALKEHRTEPGNEH